MNEMMSMRIVDIMCDEGRIECSTLYDAVVSVSYGVWRGNREVRWRVTI